MNGITSAYTPKSTSPVNESDINNKVTEKNSGHQAPITKEHLNMANQIKEILSITEDFYDNLSLLNSLTSTSGFGLELPDKEFSADELVALLSTLNNKIKALQLDSAKNIENNQREMAQINNATMEKLQELAEKAEKAKRAGFFAKVFGYIGKVFGLIASALGTAALAFGSAVSGGAAAPLLALSIVGMISAASSLANQISAEAGGPTISLGNLFKTMWVKILQAFNVPEDQIDNIAKIVSGASVLALSLIEPSIIGDLVAGSMGLAGSNPETIEKVKMGLTAAVALATSIALMAVSFSKAFEKIVNVGESTMNMTWLTAHNAARFATVEKGRAAVGQGIASAIQAKYDRSYELAIADKDALKAIMVALRQTLELEQEQIKKIIQEIQDALQVVTGIIRDMFESRAQVTRNLA